MHETFGASARAADDYVRRARARWAADAAEARSTERERTIARLSALARTLEGRAAWGPLVQVERLLADVRGVRAAQRVDITTSTAPARDDADMTPAEAAEALAECVPTLTTCVRQGRFESIDGLRREVTELLRAIDDRTRAAGDSADNGHARPRTPA
jgi:hypothetical protein